MDEEEDLFLWRKSSILLAFLLLVLGLFFLLLVSLGEVEILSSMVFLGEGEILSFMVSRL